MTRQKIGSIKFLYYDEDGVAVWQAKAERRAGGRRSASKRVRGTERDAQIAAAELARSLAATSKAGALPSITLDEYFYGVYQPWMRERAYTNEHISNVVKNYERHIRPAHGCLELSKIREEDARELIRTSTAAGNTHRYYRAIMNKAYEDGYLSHRFDLRRSAINYTRVVKRKPAPWSVGEFRNAMEKLKGVELCELYMLTASTGLRTEEALALKPRRLLMLESQSADGSISQLLAFDIQEAYTDADGMKRTKTTESARIATVAPVLKDRLIELVSETMPIIEELAPGVQSIRYFCGYKRSRKPVYDARIFRGSRCEVMEKVAELYESGQTAARYPKVERVAEDAYLVKLLTGYENQVVKKYDEEAFVGSAEAARKAATESWLDRRIMPCTHNYLNSRWRKALDEAGIRYIPPSSLRSMSETFSSRAGIADGVTSKIHGHTTYKTDYNNYLGIGLDDHVAAAEKINDLLTNPSAAIGTRAIGIDW